MQIPYFTIEGTRGGSQAWMRDPFMRAGGCGALAACDVCISLSLSHGLGLYPYDLTAISRRDYRRFAGDMKPFLRPRLRGIDTTGIFTEGFRGYLRAAGKETLLTFREVSGDRPVSEALDALSDTLQKGIPVPYLNLKHADPAFRDYVWHWFMLTGIDHRGQVLASSYGKEAWLDFKALWGNGYEKKGGFVLITPRQ